MVCMLSGVLQYILKLPLVYLLEHMSDMDNNIMVTHILPHSLSPLQICLSLLTIYYLIRPLSHIPQYYCLLLTLASLTGVRLLCTLSIVPYSLASLSGILFVESVLIMVSTLVHPINTNVVLKSTIVKLQLSLFVMYGCVALLPSPFGRIMYGLANLFALSSLMCNGRLVIWLFETESFIPFALHFELPTEWFSVMFNPNILRFYGLVTCVVIPWTKMTLWSDLFTCHGLAVVLGEFSASYLRILSLSAFCSYFGLLFAKALTYLDIESDVVSMLEVLYATFIIWMSLVHGLPTIPNANDRVSLLINNWWLLSLNTLYLLQEIIKTYVKDMGGYRLLPLSDIRPLLSSLLVLCMSNAIGLYLFHIRSKDVWLLTIGLLVLENSASALSALIIHAYFLYKRHNDLIYSESLEFVVSVVAEAIKFVLGMLLLGTSVYTYVKKGRIFRLFTIVLHFYVNIYVKSREVYDYLKRHFWATTFFRNVPRASQEQLDKRSNMCSICIDDLNCDDSCYLNCTHVFHLSCLKEWTAIKRRCPVCSSSLIRAQ